MKRFLLCWKFASSIIACNWLRTIVLSYEQQNRGTPLISISYGTTASSLIKSTIWACSFRVWNLFLALFVLVFVVYALGMPVRRSPNSWLLLISSSEKYWANTPARTVKTATLLSVELWKQVMSIRPRIHLVALLLPSMLPKLNRYHKSRILGPILTSIDFVTFGLSAEKPRFQLGEQVENTTSLRRLLTTAVTADTDPSSLLLTVSAATAVDEPAHGVHLVNGDGLYRKYGTLLLSSTLHTPSTILSIEYCICL